MIILGLDPGIQKLGWAIIEKGGNNLSLKDYGLITTEPNLEKIYRFKEIKNQLIKLIKKYHPNILALEKILFFKNKKTAIEIAQVIGLIISLTADYKINLFEFTPLEIKLNTTGYGRANKLNVKKMMDLYFNLSSNFTDDIYDAIAIALAASHKVT